MNCAIINSIDDVIKILGLLYSKGMWSNNAEELIKKGVPFCDIIATVEDVFDYLVLKGLSEKDAYRVAQSVGRGRGVGESDEELMRLYYVPKWYIDFCKRIRQLVFRAQCISYGVNLR